VFYAYAHLCMNLTFLCEPCMQCFWFLTDACERAGICRFCPLLCCDWGHYQSFCYNFCNLGFSCRGKPVTASPEVVGAQNNFYKFISAHSGAPKEAKVT